MLATNWLNDNPETSWPKRDQEEIPFLHRQFGHKNYHKKMESKSLFNSFLVILKSGLCLNNKSTSISIVSFKGMLVSKLFFTFFNFFSNRE